MDMTNKDMDDARGHLADAQTSINAATDLIPKAPVPVVDPPITDAEAFDRAYAAAAPFAILTLPTTFVYPGPLTLRKPVTIISETYDAHRETRMTLDEPAPRFLGGVTLAGDDIYWMGIETRHTNVAYPVLKMCGARNIVDRPRVLGDPKVGGKRGIEYTGAEGRILNWYVDDIFLPQQDSQAIYSSSMGPGGLIIHNGFGRAAGEVIMFGGDDSGSADRAPRGVRLTDSTLTKKPEWLDVVSGTLAGGTAKHRVQCKNALEFKHMDGATVNNCIFEYGGTSEGQGAYLLVLTPRNQYGREAWTTVRNITITNCIGRHGGGLATFLGDDNRFPTQRMSNIAITNFLADDLDRTKFGGSGRVFFINRAPADLHLEAITASGSGLKSIVYCDEKAPPTGLVLRNFKVPTVIYPYHSLAGNTLAALKTFAPDAVLEITPSDVGATLVG